MIQKAYIFDYATHYHLTHASIPNPIDFKLTDAEYDEFMSFIKDKEYDYTTKSEKLLEDLKKSTEEDKKFDNVKAEFEALKAKVAHNKTEDLLKYKSEISSLIQEEIASRYKFQKGRLESSLQTDNEVKEAVKVLNDTQKYNDILTTVNKPTHPFHSEKFKNANADKGK